MRALPIFLKTVMLGAAFMAVALFLLWVASGWWWVEYDGHSRFRSTPGRDWIGVGSGVVFAGSQVDLRVPPYPLKGLYAIRAGGWFWWWFQFESGLTFYRVIMPIWLPFIGSAVLACLAWHFERIARRRAQLGRCFNCGYDRAGIAADAVCPECGADSAGATGQHILKRSRMRKVIKEYGEPATALLIMAWIGDRLACWWLTGSWAPPWMIEALLCSFTLLVGVPTVAVRLADAIARRRARVGKCPKCGYDRAGIAANAVCPECGAAGMVATQSNV